MLGQFSKSLAESFYVALNKVIGHTSRLGFSNTYLHANTAIDGTVIHAPESTAPEEGGRCTKATEALEPARDIELIETEIDVSPYALKQWTICFYQFFACCAIFPISVS